MSKNASNSLRLWVGRIVAVLWLLLSVAAPAHAIADDLHADHGTATMDATEPHTPASNDGDSAKDHFCHAASCHAHWLGGRIMDGVTTCHAVRTRAAMIHHGYSSRVISPDLRPPMG